MPLIFRYLTTAIVALGATVSALPAATDLASRDPPANLVKEITMAAALAMGLQNDWEDPSAIGDAKPGSKSISTCPLTDIELPKASASLPAANGTLSYIALGRGTQNYTCASSAKDSKPASAGAVALLFDMSCPAARLQPIIGVMSPLGMAMPAPPGSTDRFLGLELIGHHYFTTGSTPTFNLDTTHGDAGYVSLESAGKAPAPNDAPRGVDGTGFGAVDWLALRQKAGPQGRYGQQSFQTVFRVNTAGGNPPASCENMPSDFQVQYTAQYWFFR